jgi:hypothetical protein
MKRFGLLFPIFLWVLIGSMLLTIPGCSQPQQEQAGTQHPVQEQQDSTQGQNEYPITVTATVVQVLPDDTNGAKHQRMYVHIDRILDNPKHIPVDKNQNVFVAIRYGDKDGLQHRLSQLDHGKGIHLELKGMYVPKQGDNRPVLHFTHHPTGYVKVGDQVYQ